MRVGSDGNPDFMEETMSEFAELTGYNDYSTTHTQSAYGEDSHLKKDIYNRLGTLADHNERRDSLFNE